MYEQFHLDNELGKLEQANTPFLRIQVTCPEIDSLRPSSYLRIALGHWEK